MPAHPRTTIAAAHRPLTSTFSPALESLILGAVPVFTPEHLCHAWYSLSIAGLADDPGLYARAMASARNGLAHARYGLARVKPKQRALAAREIEALERLIAETR